ncbi:ABC transporter permease [Dermatophilus congolensis]|nr:ABC transporter permease [Dermatophilus congolensis]MBO3151587.1 ABC transporter permease [Dermatophilus congolensis]MBO3161410.1 ABC transporter permease [Dermatophilus congolensis]MBO3162872.1 ABC transporter permease [Dermatophilus congolensis]MBO3176426.1 ABC transporter permease [Dermatophilus congolensis]
MCKYARRVLMANFGAWVPAMVTIAIVTALVTMCSTQFFWTRDSKFIDAVNQQRYSLSEFTIVAQTIYIVVLLLAFFSLTVVGKSTVDSTRRIFAQWRLIGATPRDVRFGTYSIIALCSLLGAAPGTVLGTALSYVVVPTFNQLAASGFDTPILPPSLLAVTASFTLSVFTCFFGAIGSVRIASRARPIEVFRSSVTTQKSKQWWKVPTLAILLLIILSILILVGVTDGMKVGLSFVVNTSLHNGMMAVLFIFLMGKSSVIFVLKLLGNLAGKAGSVTGRLAAQAASERAVFSANTIAPLAAGLGSIGVILVSIESAASIIKTLDSSKTANMVDTLVIVALIAVVLLATSAAVISLSSRQMSHERSLLRIAGMPRKQITIWYLWQGFLLSLTATLLAASPILVAMVTAAISSVSYVGYPIIVFPWLAIIFGVVSCWIVLFLVQWLPARRSLSEDIAVGLRSD